MRQICRALPAGTSPYCWQARSLATYPLRSPTECLPPAGTDTRGSGRITDHLPPPYVHGAGALSAGMGYGVWGMGWGQRSAQGEAARIRIGCGVVWCGVVWSGVVWRVHQLEECLVEKLQSAHTHWPYIIQSRCGSQPGRVLCMSATVQL
jgi:hypothetical protein